MTDTPDESPLTFPCEFPVKAMGLATAGFEEHVLDIFRRHASGFDESLITRRESQGGKYVSITVTIEAQSRDQLDLIYQELTDSDRVVMAL